MYDSISDEELVEKILSENLELFELIVNRYSKRLYNYLLRIMYFHVEDAEDALSETMLKAYLSLNGFNPKLKFSSWIYRIAHNQAIDILRKRKYKIVPLEDNLDHFIFTPNLTFHQKDDLEKLLKTLKEKDRNLLTLFYLEEKSVKEISDILKERPQTVTVSIHRARQRAQKIIKNQFHKLNYEPDTVTQNY